MRYRLHRIKKDSKPRVIMAFCKAAVDFNGRLCGFFRLQVVLHDSVQSDKTENLGCVSLGFVLKVSRRKQRLFAKSGIFIHKSEF